jgi:hypothetical protein
MEDNKELFYMKLLEYEENLPKHYDKEKFVLAGLKIWSYSKLPWQREGT